MSNETELTIFTIGFTKKSADAFFSFLRRENVSQLIDVRLNNVSQLAGFAKRDDLKFFLKELCSAEYTHLPELAPTKDILDSYKKKEMSWERYEDAFLNLMAKRNIERTMLPLMEDRGCLLCSEHEPHHCHRRLVVDYLNTHSNSNLIVKHLY